MTVNDVLPLFLRYCDLCHWSVVQSELRGGCLVAVAYHTDHPAEDPYLFVTIWKDSNHVEINKEDLPFYNNALFRVLLGVTDERD